MCYVIIEKTDISVHTTHSNRHYMSLQFMISNPFSCLVACALFDQDWTTVTISTLYLYCHGVMLLSVPVSCAPSLFMGSCSPTVWQSTCYGPNHRIVHLHIGFVTIVQYILYENRHSNKHSCTISFWSVLIILFLYRPCLWIHSFSHHPLCQGDGSAHSPSPDRLTPYQLTTKIK